MTTQPPPDPPYFDGINFNPSFYDESNSSGITQEQANTLYLQKTIPDSATALQTFSGGLNFSGEINGPTIRLSASVKTNDYQSSSISNPLSLGNNQTGSGAILNIGCNIARNGPVNIASTQQSGTGNIVIGSNQLTSGSQSIIIRRPLTIGYGVSEAGLSHIGGTIQAALPVPLIYLNDNVITSNVDWGVIGTGTYIFNYQINFSNETSTSTLLKQEYALTSVTASLATTDIISNIYASYLVTETLPVSPTTDGIVKSILGCSVFSLSTAVNVYFTHRVDKGGTGLPKISIFTKITRLG